MDALDQLDVDGKKEIHLADKYVDVAALFIYLYDGTYEKKETTAILSLLDKWEGTIELAASLLTCIDDLKYIPYHVSGYMLNVLKHFTKTHGIDRVNEEIVKLPDHVVGKLTKIFFAMSASALESISAVYSFSRRPRGRHHA